MPSASTPTAAAESPADPATLAALLVQSDLVALALLDRGTLLFANTAFRTLCRWAGDQPGTRLADLVDPASRDHLAAMLLDAARDTASAVVAMVQDGRAPRQVELRGRAVPGRPGLYAILALDVTEQARATAGLNLLAFSDPLTGLANRALFADRLREAVLAARRDKSTFALLMFDLDGFKQVNDRHGHAAGDAVLQQVAGRLQSGLRATETIARLGGDEFAVLLRDLRQPDDAGLVADRLLAAIGRPIALGRATVTVGATVAIATFPDHGATVEQLLLQADTALFAAKRAGGGGHVWAGELAPGGETWPLILWGGAHELGVPQMDTQHARLAELLNALAETLQNGRDPRPAFGEFVRYAAFHFASEEQLMVQAGYAGAARHGDEHRRLLADVTGLVLNAESTSASLPLRYLQEWLFRHVDGADRAFAGALRADVCDDPAEAGAGADVAPPGALARR